MPGSNGGPKPVLKRPARRDASEVAAKSRTLARINALKHGMTSNSPVIPEVEDEGAWQRHLDGFLESFAPVGFVEDFLVRRLATLGWSFHRCTRSEVAATMKRIQKTELDLTIAANYLAEPLPEGEIHEPDPDAVREEQLSRLLPPDYDLERIMRYATHIHRQFVQILHELEALQARRRGEHPSLTRLDISAPPNLGPHRSAPQITDFLADPK
jgi:hypothetical protein